MSSLNSTFAEEQLAGHWGLAGGGVIGEAAVVIVAKLLLRHTTGMEANGKEDQSILGQLWWNINDLIWTKVQLFIVIISLSMLQLKMLLTKARHGRSPSKSGNPSVGFVSA